MDYVLYFTALWVALGAAIIAYILFLCAKDIYIDHKKLKAELAELAVEPLVRCTACFSLIKYGTTSAHTKHRHEWCDTIV